MEAQAQQFNLHFESYTDPDECNQLLVSTPGLVELMYHTIIAVEKFLPDHRWSLHQLPGEIHILIRDKPNSYLKEVAGNEDRRDRDNVWLTKYEKENDKDWTAFMHWRDVAMIQYGPLPAAKKLRMVKIVTGQDQDQQQQIYRGGL